MQVLIPALLARLGVEVTDKRKTLAEHEAKATDAASTATVRQRANDAIVAQTPYLSALEQVRPKIGECFQVLLVEPLAKHTHNALDSTLDYAVRDYADKGSMKRRGQVCNGFRTESSLLYIAKRITGIKGADARATSFVSSNLLSMPLPDMFLKLPPILVLSKPKLAAVTPDPDSTAAQFPTTELMKTKLQYRNYSESGSSRRRRRACRFSARHPAGSSYSTGVTNDGTMRRGATTDLMEQVGGALAAPPVASVAVERSE